jgi:hypothetical protein
LESTSQTPLKTYAMCVSSEIARPLNCRCMSVM